MISRELQIEIAKATMELAGANLPAFEKFMRALTKRVDEIGDQLVVAKPDVLFQAQGRAQEARELLTTLTNAPTLARQLQAKDELREKGQPNGRDQIRAF